MKSKIVPKKVAKKAVVVDKKKIKRDLLKKKFKQECSLVEEENGKCLIIFQSPEWDKDTIDRDLGLIAVLMLKKIMHSDVYSRESKSDWKEGEGADELVFEYDKKHTKKIKELEIKYFFREFEIDAKTMSDVMMFNVNFLSPKNWREPLAKRRTGERDRDHDERIENMKKRMADAEKEMMRKVEFKRGSKSMLIMSERKEGENKEDHENRIKIMKKAMADQSKENLDLVK